MSITIQDLIEYFEKQIKGFKTQQKNVAEKRKSIEHDKARAFRRERLELNNFLEESLKQPEYHKKIKDLASAMVLDFDRQKLTLQTKKEHLQSSIDDTMQKIEDCTAVYEKYQHLQDTWAVFNAEDSLGSSRLNYQIYQEKYHNYLSKQQEYQCISVYASLPRTFLDACVDDGWLVALWKQRKHPELKSFYQCSKQDRRKWADLHELDMLNMIAGDIKHTEEYLGHLSIRIEQLGIKEQQLKQQVDLYYQEHKETIQKFEELQRHIQNEQKEYQRTLDKLKNIEEKIERSHGQAYQEAKEMVIEGNPSFGALSTAYQQKLRIIEQNEKNVNSQCNKLLSQLEKLENTLTKTKAKFEKKLNDLTFKTRRLSYYDKRSKRIHTNTHDYARDIDNSYDIDNLDFDALFLGFIGGAFLASNISIAEHNIDSESSNIDIPDVDIPDVSIPDINVPDVAIPEISIPEISIPDISVPEVSIPDTTFGSSFDSFGSD